MSATLSISPFSNFLIITNILHNYILYAFLFYPFYHKLTINHQFFDIFFLLLQNSIWAFRYIEWYKYRAKLKNIFCLHNFSFYKNPLSVLCLLLSVYRKLVPASVPTSWFLKQSCRINFFISRRRKEAQRWLRRPTTTRK